MKTLRLSLRSNVNGGGASEVVIGAAVIVLILFPIFSVVVEKYIINVKALIIKDALDVTNISTYVSIDSKYLGKTVVIHNEPEVEAIYRRLLACNLNLNEDLSPKVCSIADGKVIIEDITIYSGEHAATCLWGTEIVRPTVHSLVIVPVKPSLYRQIILKALGKSCIELKIHVDSDIPVNN
jgi:hypothetical protein